MELNKQKIVVVAEEDSVDRDKLLVVEVVHVDHQETQPQLLVAVASNLSKARVFKSVDHDQNPGFSRT